MLGIIDKNWSAHSAPVLLSVLRPQARGTVCIYFLNRTEEKAERERDRRDFDKIDRFLADEPKEYSSIPAVKIVVKAYH